MKPPIVMVLTIMLSACSSPVPVLEAGSKSADPNVSVPRVRYIPVTAGTRDYRPVGPKPWTEQGSQATPKPEGSQGVEQKSDEQSKSDAESTPAQEAQ
jgi:hypothetical protein